MPGPRRCGRLRATATHLRGALVGDSSG
jgi:hypothetical protein